MATKTCRYEPGINATYQEMATHYGTAVIPARVRKPRDKAKVEAGVQFVQRFILAGLRHITPSSAWQKRMLPSKDGWNF